MLKLVIVKHLCLALVLLATLASAKEKPPSDVEKLAEQGLIYQPRRGPVRPPAGVQNLYIQTDDGVRLNAWWLPPLPNGPTILYFHDNGGDLASLDGLFDLYRRCGFGALAIDYRGYGLSEGHPSEEGLYRDARAAYRECLKRGVPPSRLLVHGQSLGGAMAVQVASENPCAGVILESTFTSMTEMARRVYGPVAAGLMVTRYASLSKVKSVQCPALVIHGDVDDFVPASMGKALYAKVPGLKRLWLVKGAGHNNVRRVAGAEFGVQLLKFWRDCAGSLTLQL